MGHVVNQEAEAILDKEFKVLDKGFVRLVDYLGGDQRIVQAARVSYGAGTKTVREDRGLIGYLIRNQHTSPLEQVILTFHAKMPIFVARQWIRHRTARLNEISARYSVLDYEFYMPDPKTIRCQSEVNKQGRGEEEVSDALKAKVLEILKRDQESAYAGYEAMLEDDIARELARVNLPVSIYTEWYWQIDLHNLFHFLKLRMDWHAQYEIRAYAEVMAEITQKVAPMAYGAFEEYLLHGARMSRKEIDTVKALLVGEAAPELTKSQSAELARKLGFPVEEFRVRFLS